MSQVYFDAPYASLSQGDIDPHLDSTFEPIDQAIAKRALDAEKTAQTLPLETDTLRFEQAYDDESQPRLYCYQEWVERKGAGIYIYDRKTDELLRTLSVPDSFKTNDRTVETVLLTKDRFFGLTQARRILVWDRHTGQFLEQLALPHEAIIKMALSDGKLVVETNKDRYLAVDIS